jgi:DNA-binding winged helix-turn-helix (wHTH) protein
MKMQTVNSALLEAVHIPGGRFNFDTPDVELTLTSDVADFVPAFQQIARLELDTYRIALVPLPGQHSDAARKPSAMGKIANLLLLPFTWKELMTQVRRDAGTAAKTHVLSFGDVRIDLLSMEVQRRDQSVVLTSMEFKVLKFFVLNPNRVISRDELLNQVWGYDNYPCTRTVDNHLMRLRQKLEPDAANPIHFRTVHGIGYKFLPEPRVGRVL